MFVEKMDLKKYIPAIFPPPYTGVQAIPLVEVSSISINGNGTALFEGGEPCQIYGVVQVLKGEDILFDLYKRDQSEPEVVCLGGTLSLKATPSNCAISPSPNFKLKVHLVDKYRKVEIANKFVTFVSGWENYSQVIKAKPVKGKYGLATVFYTLFRSAVLANLGVKITNEVDPVPRNSLKVHGKIYARYESEFGRSNSDVGEGFPLGFDRGLFDSLLFNKDESEPFEVKQGGSIELSKCMVAVPAYGSLIVDVNLFVNGRVIISDTAKFQAAEIGSVCEKFKVDIPCHNCEIEVFVDWFPTDKLVRDQNLYGALSNISPCRYTMGEPPSPSSLGRYEGSKLEVFSIFLGRPHCIKTLDVYGTLSVLSDANESHFLFDRDIKYPETLIPSDRILPLNCSQNASLGDGGTFFNIDLKSTKKEFVVGGSYCAGESTSYDGRLWYDTPMCTVFRGQNGYAAMHYTVLSRGVYASIKLSLLENGKGYVFARVYGSIVSEYACWDYPTPYDQKYFRSTLFQRSQKTPFLICGGTNLMLSRDTVAVPLKSSIRISFDLSARPCPHPTGPLTRKAQYLKKVVEFKAKIDGVSNDRIESEHYCLQVTVNWSDKLPAKYT